MRKVFPKDKKGALVSGIVSGAIGLVLLVVIGFIIISTILDADLLPAGTNSTGDYVNVDYNGTASALSTNLTLGINEVAQKLPTILLIAAVVLLFGVLVFLVAASRRMGVGGGSSL